MTAARQNAADRIRVYLVEDQALLRESLRTMLGLEPEIEVVGEAMDAERALRDLDGVTVDLVLMNIRLPGMDGIEATRQLKKKHKDVDVLMVTSYQDEFVGDAIEAGASGYILKSCTRGELVRAVRDVCEGKTPIDTSLTGRLAMEVVRLRKEHRESLLSQRQIQILELVANGIDYSEVAASVFVSKTTVSREMRTIFERLGVRDAAHAVYEAHKRGLI